MMCIRCPFSEKMLKFLIMWNLGDQTWISRTEAKHLEALDVYLEKLGVATVQQLPKHTRNLQEDDDSSADDQIEPIDLAEARQQSMRVEDLEQDDVEKEVQGTQEDSPIDSSNLPEELDFTTWGLFQEQHPQYKTHHVKMCSEADAKVPDFIGGALPRKDKGNREDYCMTMLTLFKPWRNGRDLKATEATWDETLTEHAFTERQSEVMVENICLVGVLNLSIVCKSLQGGRGHFRSKIDGWGSRCSQQSRRCFVKSQAT